MASNFYIVHHTARLGVSHKYFENMESWWTEDRGKQFNENLQNAGIHIHKGMFINKNLVFCIYEARGTCLLYTSPSPRDRQKSRMPSSA